VTVILISYCHFRTGNR